MKEKKEWKERNNNNNQLDASGDKSQMSGHGEGDEDQMKQRNTGFFSSFGQDSIT